MEFIKGFAEGAKIADLNRAREQWAGWSRQMSDSERNSVEAGGYSSGVTEGNIYADSHVEN